MDFSVLICFSFCNFILILIPLIWKVCLNGSTELSSTSFYQMIGEEDWKKPIALSISTHRCFKADSLYFWRNSLVTLEKYFFLQKSSNSEVEDQNIFIADKYWYWLFLDVMDFLMMMLNLRIWFLIKRCNQNLSHF